MSNLERFYQAMAILRQKIERLLKHTPDVLEINSLQKIPADKRELVEYRLWSIFVYGEYYVEKMAYDLSQQAIVPTTTAGKAHFDFHRKKYKSFIEVLKGLIDVARTPKRSEAEIAILKRDPDFQLYLENGEIQDEDITTIDIAQFFDVYGPDYDMDDYKKCALDGWLQEYIREHIENTVENRIPDAKSPVKTCFENMLEIVRDYRQKIREKTIDKRKSIVYLDSDSPEIMREVDKVVSLAQYLAISDYEEVIEKPYFKPDDWLANEKDLPPFIVNRELNQIPRRIQRRIHEVRLAFIFSNLDVGYRIIPLSVGICHH